MLQGQRADAIPHFQQALALEPDQLLALNESAWILATHPEEKCRNSPEAVRLMEHACALAEQIGWNFWGARRGFYAEGKAISAGQGLRPEWRIRVRFEAGEFIIRNQMGI